MSNQQGVRFIVAAKKAGLTLEQHRELGAKLRQIHEVLVHEGVELANAYPKDSREGGALLAIVDAFREARNTLDNAVCREHPDDQSVTSIYFGPPDKA